VNSRNGRGGTAPAQVRLQLDELAAQMASAREFSSAED